MARPRKWAGVRLACVGLLAMAACGAGAPAQQTPPPTSDAGEGGTDATTGPGDMPDAVGTAEVAPDGGAAVDGLPPLPPDAAVVPPADDALDGAPADGPPASLFEMLTRDWYSDTDDFGDCANVKNWYTFGADGTIVNRRIDENQCPRGPQLLAKFTGTYILRDRILEMTLDGYDGGHPYLVMAKPKEAVTRRLERFPIIGGVVSPPWIRAGHLALDDTAYVSGDGAHFESERTLELDGASGTRLFEQHALYQVTVDPPLPLAVGTPCKVDIDFSLTLLDAAAAKKTENGSFHMTYPAIIRATEDGWLRLVPQNLDGLDNEAQGRVWTTMMESAGLWRDHSMRFAQTFAANFVYYLGHPVGDPHVLTQSLPQIGRWFEATRPVPIR